MFLPNSRYAKTPTAETVESDGKKVVALKLRRLPLTTGQPYSVKDNDQLDHLALEHYNDPTQYWHIADANTQLQARDLLRETGNTILIPES